VHLGVDRLALYGSSIAGELIFGYPGSRSERVSHLIVGVPPYRRGYFRRLTALRPLMEQDWELFTEIWARLTMDWDEQRGSELGVRIRATHTPASFESAWAALAFSAEPLLAAIRAPALILHGLGSEGGQSGRPGAGRRHRRGTPSGDPELAISQHSQRNRCAAVLEFINTRTSAPGAPIAAPQIDVSAVRTIVFTDVEGSTALNERLGDEGAREVLREHERLTREALASHGGSEVKAMGDGLVPLGDAGRGVRDRLAESVW